MIMERNLEDYKKMFQTNLDMRPEAVRGMEKLSEWDTAAEYWLKIGRKTDSDACRMIADATQKGDAYRADMLEINQWIDKTVEAGIMEKEQAVKVVQPEIQKIYKKYFS
jgi:hypothetical protein